MRDSTAVLYSNAGTLGHTVMARNYLDLLKEHGAPVWSGELLSLDPGWMVEFVKAMYFGVLRYSPWMWRLFHNHWLYLPGIQTLRREALPGHFRKSAGLLEERQPRLVVSTHPFATALVARMKRSGLIQSKLVAAGLDWALQPYWCFEETDLFFVTLPEQRKRLVEMGVPARRIVETGFLVAREYRNERDKAAARGELGLPGNKPVVLLMGGGTGWRVNEAMAALVSIKVESCLVVIAGSEARKAAWEERYVHSLRQVDLRLRGFEADPSPYFHAADLLVTKPGGLTTAQAFACSLPVVCVNPMPGHEEENLRVLRRVSAVEAVDSAVQLRETVTYLLREKGARQELARRAKKLVPAGVERVILSTFAATLS